jgi:hypothetical protein
MRSGCGRHQLDQLWVPEPDFNQSRIRFETLLISRQKQYGVVMCGARLVSKPHTHTVLRCKSSHNCELMGYVIPLCISATSGTHTKKGDDFCRINNNLDHRLYLLAWPDGCAIGVVLCCPRQPKTRQSCKRNTGSRVVARRPRLGTGPEASTRIELIGKQVKRSFILY